MATVDNAFNDSAYCCVQWWMALSLAVGLLSYEGHFENPLVNYKQSKCLGSLLSIVWLI